MIHGAGVVHSITGLASDGSGLIAVRPGPGGGGVAYFSPNGHSWQYSATLGATGGFSPQVAKGSAYGFVVTGTGPAGNYQAYTSTGDGSTWLPTGSLGTTAASKLSQQAVLLHASTSGLVRPVTLASLPGAVVPEIAVKSLIAVGSADG